MNFKICLALNPKIESQFGKTIVFKKLFKVYKKVRFN